MFCIVNIIITLILFAILFFYLSYRIEKKYRISDQYISKEEVSSIITQFYKAADENIALLDDRIKHLNQLLMEYDLAITKYPLNIPKQENNIIKNKSKKNKKESISKENLMKMKKLSEKHHREFIKEFNIALQNGYNIEDIAMATGIPINKLKLIHKIENKKLISEKKNVRRNSK